MEATPALLLELVHDIVNVSGGFGDVFKRDCTDLVRRISFLTYLFEEVQASYLPAEASGSGSSSSSAAATVEAEAEAEASPKYVWLNDLVAALNAAKRIVVVAGSFDSNSLSDGASKKIAFQFQCVTCKLEKALANLPYERFNISEEVQEQVGLVRSQLRRATEKYGSFNSKVLSRSFSEPLDRELVDYLQCNNTGNEVAAKPPMLPKGNSVIGSSENQVIRDMGGLRNSSVSSELCGLDETDDDKEGESDTSKKPDSVSIPDDYLCPISLELMRDPVIVASGQTYERSFIQRWIDGGNVTCPKTRQQLQNLTLTTNYVLRSLISQWCAKHNIEQPSGLTNGRLKKSDGSYVDVSGDLATIEALVHKLASRSIEERRLAATEVRSLSKRSTDNRILIAEAGAIPILVNLLTTEDVLTQENAVTSILNLSIYEPNKGLVMLAGAIPSIVQVLRVGSNEARENAAATLFSLSLADENKIIIGASGAISALVELLQNGSTRGRKDAATALFNLCIYQGNKGRAIRAGIVTPLIKMLKDSNGSMVDEALTILSVLVSHHEAKIAVVKAGTIPILIDLTRTGLPRNKENAAAILLSLCKRDNENLGFISRLGAVIPLSELAKSGTERAKRKATSLLEHLRKLQQQQP